MRQVLFRTDASVSIGSGHVMRCLALAEALRTRGWTAVFACGTDPGHLCDLIEKRGFPVVRLTGGTDGGDTTADAEETGVVLDRIRADWLVVDHYRLDATWEGAVRTHVPHLLAIDDLANRRHVCDLLVDQSLVADASVRYDGLVPPDCMRLLGPGYALLRDEFRIARRSMRRRAGAIGRVLVFFGGSDPTGETNKALDAIGTFAGSGIRFDVVVGISNPGREDIALRCSGMDGVAFHCQTDRIAALMAAADLALGAGGTSTWERCCVGLPAVIVTVADNQRTIAASSAAAGFALHAGDASHATAATYRDALAWCTRHPGQVAAMSRAAATVCDGEGTQRVAESMERFRA